MSHSNRHNLKPRRSEPGILSNVLSFVSREIGEFVINATGKAESGPSKLKRGHDTKLEERGRQRKGYDGGMIEQWREASGSVDGGGEKQPRKTKDRRKLSTDGRGRTRRGKERNDGKRRAASGSPPPSRSAERSYSQSQSQSREPSRSKKPKARTSDGKQPNSRAKSADSHGRKNQFYVDRPEDADGEEIQHPPKDQSSSEANPPPPLHLSHPISAEAAYPQLRKKPSITMPGSLFPRSDSLEPGPDDAEMESRRVRFLSAAEDTRTHERNPNPIPRTPQSTLDAQDLEPGPSSSQNATPADKTGPSPWRTRPIASVHDAVQRFTASGGEERDFSLLVIASPAGPVDLKSPGTVLEMPHSSLGGVSRKGKERAVDNGDDDLEFILDRHRVQDKEKQLDAVRRETGAKTKTTGDGDRERDKERIRMLEEEVRMLKEELSHRHRSSPPSQTQIPIPPPPPPLPPPPGVRIPLPPHLGESRALFASARAALRSTEGSTTKGTNELTRSASGKVRQPTVNVPSDKMAAFLNEMRTVRLRKVGPIPEGMNRSVSDRPAGDRPGPSGLSRSVSSGTGGVEGRREEMARRKSMGVNVPVGSAASNPGPSRLASTSSGNKPASTLKLPSASSIPKPKYTSTAPKSSYPPPSSNVIDPRINNKRKADALGESEGGSASKRRSGTRDQARSDTSASSSSSSRTHEFSSGSTHSNLSLTVPSLPNHSSLSNETDITTPSLCSDNELGGDDGRMPSTPPGPRSAAAAAQNAHDEGIDIIDVDMEDIDVEPAHKHVTPSRPQGDIFRKRPPMSPLPVPTPTRVPAPARAKKRKSVPTPERTKRGATPKPKSIMLLDEDDEDDEDGEEEPDELALPPKLTWRREAQPRATEKSTAANSKGKRRLTLDEELARARSSDRLVELGLESGELVGTGTGSKQRGFLAGGGAGGAPVFMGVGYVRDVEEDGLRQPMSRIPRRRG
ncbi:hypothetical protein DEU56DRAFT_772001 [Suillus clintonianus]|uniref:uncharacterized protein n=1 Tax=Suillus clintonianus TaxID=1904413 RepID=UPI001B875F8B|nr:uncharacterized protein DEU56DRAFT_772001 [Suillus clintonianus]KAG2153957.1 hypothetical protein DEU56DRAFT_772001 [Suillus clintonianus]